jgi:ribulose-5-phosphate 4-epimerase/fuculose-1-phosphate aldolase
MITTTHSHYDSSTVKSAAYNVEHKTLTVHFNHASYIYKDVELADWNLFNMADSQGRALNEFIKPNYEFEKIHETV